MDQFRNLHPTLEAKVAMIVYGKNYAAQDGGSMDFWDALDEHSRRVVRMIIDTVRSPEALSSRDGLEGQAEPMPNPADTTHKENDR